MNPMKLGKMMKDLQKMQATMQQDIEALEIEISEGPQTGEIISVLAGDVTLAKPIPPSQSPDPDADRGEGVDA